VNLTIHKFNVRPDDYALSMPKGAKLLTVQMQYNEPELWALVDLHAPEVRRRFVTVPTGTPLPDEIATFVYVGTFQLHGGALVFHLFDAGEAP
jgi:hypothetical protein